MSPTTPPTVVLVNTPSPVVLEQPSDKPRRDDRPSCPDHLTWAEALGATVPLISAPAYFGPPVVFLLGPWLLLALLIIPPAAVLITLVLIVLLAAALLAALGALIASPYLLVRRLRARHLGSIRGERPVKGFLRPNVGHLTTR